jgi:F-type H+-transporting ATPase subunit delta
MVEEIGRIYAEAIFDIAEKNGTVEKTENRLINISHLFLEHQDLFNVLKTPILPPETKKNILDQIFSDDIDKNILNLIYLLIDKNRIAVFPYLAKSYKKIAAEKADIFNGEIISASPLTDKEVKEYENQISNLMRKKIVLEPFVDPTLIGGIRIFAEVKLIDQSIKGELLELKDKLSLGVVR